MNITILRQCGTRRHDDPIYYLKEKGYVDNINQVLYTVLRHIGEGIVNKKPLKNSLDALKCISRLMDLSSRSDSNIIIRATPYDILIPFLMRLKNRNNVIFHNSWPVWDRTFYVKKVYLDRQIEMWEKFLDGLKVVGVTKPAAEEVKRFGAKAYQIPHSVDTRIFRPMPEIEKNKPIKVLLVGYMVESKGILELLDIAKKSDPEEIEFWFVGKGLLAKNVKELEGKYPVKHFDFITNRGELARMYNKADIFVLPSIEFFGIVLIEAMACGLPVIGVDSVGPREIIDDGVNGFLLPKGDRSLLLEKIEVLIHDEKLREKMGIKAREKVMRKFDIEVIARKWWEVLEIQEEVKS